MAARVLGIDQGTTSTRALVLTDDGTIRLLNAGRHRQSFPHPGWVEHDPLELLGNIRRCIEQGGEASAIGLANQGESCLAWDARTGRPFSPVIVWQDARTATEIEKLRADGGEAETLQRAGLPLDPYFSASKLAWLLANNEEVKRAHKERRLRLGTTESFFIEQLTGEFSTDATTASRTSLYNVSEGDWDPVLCDIFHVPIECLPHIRDTASDFGVIGRTPITASIVDQQAGLVGHGCRLPGDMKITFGTGAFVLSITGERIVRRQRNGILPTVAWSFSGKVTYAVDGGVYDAGSALEWARSLGLFKDYAELREFDGGSAIDRGIIFVPALSGLACPHWDRSAAAMWVGMTSAATPRDLVQSVLEGIALRTAEAVEAIALDQGMPTTISIDGGISRNDYFAQFLADTLQISVRRPGFHELTAFGCAVLAANRFDDPPELQGDSERIFDPVSGRGPGWREQFARAVAKSRGWRSRTKS